MPWFEGKRIKWDLLLILFLGHCTPRDRIHVWGGGAVQDPEMMRMVIKVIAIFQIRKETQHIGVCSDIIPNLARKSSGAFPNQ